MKTAIGRMFLGVKNIAKKVLPAGLWRFLRGVKRISQMPAPEMRKTLYLWLKKKPPLPARTVYDANIVITNLETCHLDGNVHFSGECVPLKDTPIKGLSIYSKGVHLVRVEPQRRDDRLSLDIQVPYRAHNDIFEFFLEMADGTEDHLGNIDIPYLLGRRAYEKEMEEKNSGLPKPPPDVLFATSSNSDIVGYLQSVPRGIYKLKNILADVGIALENMRTVLDFGCGSGRLLRGLYIDDPGREIYGVDCNGTVIDWAQANFTQSITFIKNRLNPPLPFNDRQFDLIYLVSVFTHLPLECQQEWLGEFKRILGNNGVMVITLHGLAYLSHFRRNLPEVYEKLLAEGYIVSNIVSGASPGSNECFSAHLPEFAANTLFKDWKILSFLPGGRLRNHLSTINSPDFSGVQDIYVLSH